MATIRKKIDVTAELTNEQLNMLKEAENTVHLFSMKITLFFLKKSFHNSEGCQNLSKRNAKVIKSRT